MDEKVINAIVRCLNSPASKTLSIILGLISGFWLSNLYVTHNCQKQIKKQPQNKDYFEKELKNKKNQILISWVAISFILIAPIAINFFFSLNVLYPTAPLLGNQQWLGFWGSYMGGVIGAIVTGVAFCFTYKQNEEQHAETRKIMQEEKFKDVRPYLSADQITPSELSESYRDIEIFEYSGDSIPIPALWVISANRNQLLKKIRKCMNNYYVSCVRTTNL